MTGAGSTTLRQRLLMIGAAMLSVALIAAALMTTPRRDGRFPTRWDSRVEPLAHFVETARGHRFRHPVFVNFMTPDEYRELAIGTGGVGVDEQAYYDELEALWRALGLISGDPDLADTSTESRDVATLAYYMPAERMIYVRGTEMTASLKVTLVHELTHALQHQIFHHVIDGTRTQQEEFAARALVEGDAQRIEQEYFRSRPNIERDEIARQNQLDYDASQSSLGDKAVAMLSATRAAPYALGFSWAHTAARLPAGIDGAFATPPASEAELIDFFAYVQRVEQSAAVKKPMPAAPFVDSGSSRLGNEVGALTWYLLLAHHVDSKTALTAVAGYGSDRLKITRTDGTLCAELVFVVESRADQEEMWGALSTASNAMKPSKATVNRSDEGLSLAVCDPGPDAPAVPIDVRKLFVAPTFRNATASWALHNGLDQTQARCTVDRVFARYDAQAMGSAVDAEAASSTARRYASEIEVAQTACR